MKQLKDFQVQDKAFIPLVKFALDNEKEASRLVKIINPSAIVEMVTFGLGDKKWTIIFCLWFYVLSV